MDEILSFMCGRPCPSPLQWQDQINRDIEKLLREGVITRWTKSEPPRYLSPAHFVEKRRKPGDPLKLRMVIDLRVLNKNVKRPGTSIPSSLYLWKQIKATSKFFMTINLSSAYHQSVISEASQDLFAFRVKDEIYYFKWSPQGYSGIGDYMNLCLNRIFVGLQNLHKEMDDLLVEAKDEKTMETYLWPVLERCRTNGVRLSRSKINTGPEVDYAGLQISATDGCKPSKEKYRALLEQNCEAWLG